MRKIFFNCLGFTLFLFLFIFEVSVSTLCGAGNSRSVEQPEDLLLQDQDEKTVSSSGDDSEVAMYEDSVSTIIILNGTSSAGKTRLGKALKRRLGRGWVFQQIDDLSDGEVDDVCGDLIANCLENPLLLDAPVLSHENILMVQCIAELAEKGFNVLVDTVLPDKGEYSAFLAHLEKFRVFTVILYCPPAELERNIMKRNGEADELENTRSLSQSLDQFSTMFEKARSDSPIPVGILARQELTNLENSQVFFEPAELKRCSSGAHVAGVIKTLGFGADESHISLSPVVNYDLVLQSSDRLAENVKKVLTRIQSPH